MSNRVAARRVFSEKSIVTSAAASRIIKLGIPEGRLVWVAAGNQTNSGTLDVVYLNPPEGHAPTSGRILSRQFLEAKEYAGAILDMNIVSGYSIQAEFDSDVTVGDALELQAIVEELPKK